MKQYERVKTYQKRLAQDSILGEVTKNLEELMTETEEDAMYEVANYVLAPALNGFVAWVLKESMAQGIKRLYFLARDGYLMYQTALRYVKQYKLPVECRYLYCSRFSVRIPNYHFDMEKAFQYITLGGMDVTVKKLYQRAGFDLEQRNRMHRVGILPLEEVTQIPRQDLGKIKRQLEGSAIFRKELEETSKRALPLYEGYLKQEGLLEQLPMALVDSGWVGSMQKELNESLQRMGKKQPLKGFYWGLYEIPNNAPREEYQTYFFSPERELKRKVRFNNCLFECIFTAPHGMTLGYADRGRSIVPVLEEFSEKRKKRICQMEVILLRWQELLIDKVKAVPENEVLEHLSSMEYLAITTRNMETFMHCPTKKEVETFGELEFSDDVLEDSKQRIAARLQEKELRQNHLLEKMWQELTGKKEYVVQSAWYEGSAVMYGKRVGHHIFHYTCYKYLMHYRKTMNWKHRYEGSTT